MVVVFIVIRLACIPVVLPIVFVGGAIFTVFWAPVAFVGLLLISAAHNDGEEFVEAFTSPFRVFVACLVVPVIRMARWTAVGGNFDVFDTWNGGEPQLRW